LLEVSIIGIIRLMKKKFVVIGMAFSALLLIIFTLQSQWGNLKGQSGWTESCSIAANPDGSCPYGYGDQGGVCYSSDGTLCTCTNGASGFCGAGSCSCSEVEPARGTCCDTATSPGSPSYLTEQGCTDMQGIWHQGPYNMALCFSITSSSASSVVLSSSVQSSSVAPRCGDGTVDQGEQCDDSNTTDNDGCSRSCKNERCGDGIKQLNEECDDENTVTADACTNACTVAKCGDGVLRSGFDPQTNVIYEQCDDGNTNNDDGCDSSCKIERCGNYVIESNEMCEQINNGWVQDTTCGNGQFCCAECTTCRIACPFLDSNGSGEIPDGYGIRGRGGECGSPLCYTSCSSAVFERCAECSGCGESDSVESCEEMCGDKPASDPCWDDCHENKICNAACEDPDGDGIGYYMENLSCVSGVGDSPATCQFITSSNTGGGSGGQNGGGNGGQNGGNNGGASGGGEGGDTGGTDTGGTDGGASGGDTGGASSASASSISSTPHCYETGECSTCPSCFSSCFCTMHINAQNQGLPPPSTSRIESTCTAQCVDSPPPNSSSNGNTSSASSRSNTSSTSRSNGSVPSNGNSSSVIVAFDYHYECMQQSCVLVLTAGQDTCATDKDCLGAKSSTSANQSSLSSGSSGSDQSSSFSDSSNNSFNFSSSFSDGSNNSSNFSSSLSYSSDTSNFSSSFLSSSINSSDISNVSSSSEFSDSSASSGVSTSYTFSQPSFASYSSENSQNSNSSIVQESSTSNVSSTSFSIRFSSDSESSTSSRGSARSSFANSTIIVIAEDDDGDGDGDDGFRDNNNQWVLRPSSFIAQNVNGTLVAAASMCGNGILDVGEECDDSNRRDNDGCSISCLLEIGICGDGKVQSLLGEQCEGGIDCQKCRFVSQTCGDGIVDPREECDSGALNSLSPNADCRPDCSLSRCGDSVLDTTELCDDGNRLNSDGCDRYCRLETTVLAQQNSNNYEQLQAQMLANQQFGFPQYANYQQLPYQLPLAQLQPLIQNQGPIGDTGPAAVAVAASGMAAGVGWIRRKKRKS